MRTPLKAQNLLPYPHGFFTRQGGVSKGAFQSLNCMPRSNDCFDAIAENRRRVSAFFNRPPQALITLHQHHSAAIVDISHHNLGEVLPMGDGLVSAQAGTILGILTADCQPVLFADLQAGVIGAAHAGWKGALYGILENTLKAMEKLGARRSAIMCAIGPAISQKAYEVGAEFYDRFLSASADNKIYFTKNGAGRYQFDLSAYSAARLHRAGVAGTTILPHCTYQNADLFFSYRRACHGGNPECGRQISAIMLPQKSAQDQAPDHNRLSPDE